MSANGRTTHPHHSSTPREIRDDVTRVIIDALAEDGPADITTLATIPPDARGTARITARQPGVLAGVGVAQAVFAHLLDEHQALSFPHWQPDGHRIEPGEDALVVHGPLRALLTGERTALNLLSHLSGVATLTDTYVHAVAHTACRIRDTRKTLPGLRALQKDAVRVGGGVNHRRGLSDMALIKDNHIAATGSVSAAVHAVRAYAPDLPCEVEVDDLDQLAEAIAARAELIMLDNFAVADIATAVALARDATHKIQLEASGGITVATVADVAETGVDYVAVGALTHSVPALDLGLELSHDSGAAPTGTGGSRTSAGGRRADRLRSQNSSLSAAAPGIAAVARARTADTTSAQRRSS